MKIQKFELLEQNFNFAKIGFVSKKYKTIYLNINNTIYNKNNSNKV